MQSLDAAVADLRSILDHNPLGHVTAADVPLRGGGWTRKQILGHLIDSAANNHHRFVRAQFEPDFSMPGYAQPQWVATQEYTERPWTELVALWSAYNRHLLFLMERVPQDRLRNSVRVGAGEPMTLEFLMVDYVRHLKHHLDQILDKIESKR